MDFSNTSTICAISTPGGVGGLAVIRISGSEAITIADRIWHGKSLATCDSHTAHLGWILDSHGQRLDQGVATLFRAPGSFTGDDVVEFSVHGSVFVQRELLNALIANGCRLAEAGEFTRRAFASGRIDLAEAEAVADIIASTSRAAHKLAVSQMKGDFSQRIGSLRESLLELASLLELELDFSDQEVEFASREKLMSIAREVKEVVSTLAGTFHRGQAFRNGIPTAIVGATNVGKSTLLNRLLHDDRAIVSDIHGTTRDTIEDTAEIGGVIFRFIDTAGLRDTNDTIEAMGIERSIDRVRQASIIILVADITRPDTLGEAWTRIATALTSHNAANSGDRPEYPPLPYPSIILLWNKTDLTPKTGRTGTTNTNSNTPTPTENILAHCKERTFESDSQAATANPAPGSGNQATTGNSTLESDNPVTADNSGLESSNQATIGNSGLESDNLVTTGNSGLESDNLITTGNSTLESINQATTGNSVSCERNAMRFGNQAAVDTISTFCNEHGMEFHTLYYSAKNGTGEVLESALLQCAGADKLDASEVIVTNARHYQSLMNAYDSIVRVIDGLNANIPPEFVAQDLRQTLSSLDEITGTISTPQILSSIFSRFCIGK